MPEEAERRVSDARTDAILSSARAAVADKKPDPVVRALITTILVVIMLALVTVLYSMVTGLFGTGAPRTYTEARLMDAKAKIDAGSKESADWKQYILALIEDGQYREAQTWIGTGSKKVPDQDISADMVYMQASLDFAQGNADKALAGTDSGLKIIKDRYEEGRVKAKESGNPDKAFSPGINDNYYELLLLKAEILQKRKDWKGMLAVYDEYLGGKPMAANIFTQRGDVKAQLGDKAGAEADYRMTLKYMPGDTDALAGLKRIGASR